MVIENFKGRALAFEGQTSADDNNEAFCLWDMQECLEQELADITFEELQKARADGSLAIYLKAAHKQHKPGRANTNRLFVSHGLNLYVETMIQKGIIIRLLCFLLHDQPDILFYVCLLLCVI